MADIKVSALPAASTIDNLDLFHFIDSSANASTKLTVQQLVNYLNTVITGTAAPDATTAIKGVVEVATQTEVNNGTATGATGASLVVTPATLKVVSDNLNSSITTLQTDVTTLQTDLTAAESNITTLQSDVTTLQTDVTAAETNITNLQGDVTTLQSDVTTLQTDVTNVQGDVTTLQTDVTTLQTQVGDSTIAKTQTLATNGLYNDGTGLNADGHIYQNHSKLYDDTNKILFIISKASTAQANIRSFKFDSDFRVTHRSMTDVDLPSDIDDGNESFDFDGSHLYFTALNISSNDDFINVRKYSVDTTTGEVNPIAVATANQQIGADNTHGGGFDTIVDDTYVYALTTTHVSRFLKSSLSYVDTNTMIYRDSDGSTGIPAYNISQGWGTFKMNCDGTNYYFGTYTTVGTYKNSGFSFDSTNRKLQRTITINGDVYTGGDTSSNAQKVAANTRYIEFTYDKLPNIFSAVYMNTLDDGGVTVTTL